MGKKKIYSVSPAGNGSGQVTVPKDLLRDWGFVDEDGNVIGGPVEFEKDLDREKIDEDDAPALVVPIQ